MNFDSKTIQKYTRLGMRKSFGRIMCDLAENHKDLIIIAADVASSAGLENYIEKYPQQFFNLGIAEQNMAAVAAGMAKEGANVFIVSFAPFIAMRAFEAIRTLVGYMHLNVKTVALASGFSLGVQGNTHYCFEDLAIMKTIPGMRVISPVDCVEEMKCLEYLVDYDGPAYLRLTGIDGSPGIYKEDFDFNADSITEIKAGDDVAIISTGSVTNECVRVARALKRDDISVGVYNVHTIKPFDEKSIIDIAKKYQLIVAVEEHNIIGGLGSSVADVLAKLNSHPKLIKIGINDEFVMPGEYAYLLHQARLTAPEMKTIISEAFKTLL